MEFVQTSTRVNLEIDFKVNVWYPAGATLEEAKLKAQQYAASAERQGFKVGFREILTKMAESDIIFDYRSPDDTPAAFASLLTPAQLSFGNGERSTLIYLNGLIVEPKFARLGICKNFLRTAGDKAKIIIAHTQNPQILAAFRKVFKYVWPSSARHRLNEDFADAVAAYLQEKGRPGYFDRVSGLVTDLYPEPLYTAQAHRDTNAFPEVGAGRDGTLIIAFNSEEMFAKAVAEPQVEADDRLLLFSNPVHTRRAAKRLDTLVIGGGRAGQGLHLPCIRKAAKQAPEVVSGRPTLVERDPAVEIFQQIPRVRTIAEADCDPEKTVVHVTTGPADRLEVVAEAAERGFRFFILEKPLASSRSQLDALIKLVKEYRLKTVVNLPWLVTPLTRTLKGIIDSRKHGNLTQLVMIQTKSRQGRSSEASGHDSAFEIETPHQVSLALHLAGAPAALRDASCKPLILENGNVSFKGGASMFLSHGAAVSHLRSDLVCPVRERRIELVFEDGWRCRGWYPATGDSGAQVLSQYLPSGRWWRDETFSDDPLTSLFSESYRYFSGTGPQPASTFEIAVAAAELIHKAKIVCGIEIESLEPTSVGDFEVSNYERAVLHS